ncbi:heterokaryon incompatibility protein-domain-containing protein [Microdochium bolleyi]|uniref:Heterokaryon incompatibility protein-domain-containing protein n=1 Tax=Microdochium bolleyi TaxID=196109 RepID=A0A136IM40_9PEZI|nr:heterokaryon incompatibility protein-domain-containing protein [Microdochium bolleyi]
MTVPLFQHRPLADPGNGIRLCRFVHPPESESEGGPRTDAVVLEVAHFRLPKTRVITTSAGGLVQIENDGEGWPTEHETRAARTADEYTAVSYCWGPASARHIEITINQHALPVSESLHQLLRAFGDADKNEEHPGCRLFWIDQLCIDQRCNAERNAQVHLMSYIYSSAETVYAWLGPATSSARLGLRTLNALRPRYLRSGSTTELKITSALPALCDLLTGAYWSRLWIVQEVVLAKRLVLCCGRHRRVFQRFEDGRQHVWRRGTMLEQALRMHERLHCHEAKFSTRHITLRRALSLLRQHLRVLQARAGSGATVGVKDRTTGRYYPYGDSYDITRDNCFRACADPRDKVYALQSLVWPHQRVPVIDYGAAVEDVFVGWLGTVLRHAGGKVGLTSEHRSGFGMVFEAMGLGVLSDERAEELVGRAELLGSA